jgi:hypothetical protein
MGSYELQDTVVDGDFNDDGLYDCFDIDALVAEIASGSNASAFDLTADGAVNLSDRDAWLAEAGEINLGPGKVYLLGDADLDGTVDGLDFIRWNANKFTNVNTWCGGDFNADGSVDGLDYILWNDNKFQSSDSQSGNGEGATSEPNARSPMVSPETPVVSHASETMRGTVDEASERPQHGESQHALIDHQGRFAGRTADRNRHESRRGRHATVAAEDFLVASYDEAIGQITDSIHSPLFW